MRIFVINESSLVSDDQVLSMVAAGIVQVARDFSSVHPGKTADIVFVPSARAPTQVGPSSSPNIAAQSVPLPLAQDTGPKGSGTDPRAGADALSVGVADAADSTAAWIVMLDHTDQADVLGYHDLTPGGLPISFIGVADDQASGSSVSVTFSHELLEMLLDPYVNLAAYDPNAASPIFFAFEACDACEDDQFGYAIGGVTMSDFVTPAWFQPALAGPFDFQGQIPAAFALLPGGYIGCYDPNAGGWTQRNARVPSRFAHLLVPRKNSRRGRRIRYHAGHKPKLSAPLRRGKK